MLKQIRKTLVCGYTIHNMSQPVVSPPCQKVEASMVDHHVDCGIVGMGAIIGTFYTCR